MSFPRLSKPVLFALFLHGSGAAFALDSIGWNYDGVGDDTLGSAEIAGAGAFAQLNWNNHLGVDQGVGLLPFHLKDNEGRATSATVTDWTLTNDTSWFHGQDANPNEKLMNSFADQQPSITFSGVPESYQLDGYSVVVYYGNNEGPNQSQLSLTGSVSGIISRAIITGDTISSSYGTVGYLEETGNLSGPTNFTVFQNRYDREFTLSLVGSGNNGFCAIQMVKDSGVTSAPKSPFPRDLAPRVPRSVLLGWARARFASSYEIYFWVDGDQEPATPSFISRENAIQLPMLLQPLTTYRWRVRAVNGSGAALGEVWSFTTSNKISAQESIGWNYDGLGDDTLDPEMIAGVPPYAQANWNNHAGIDQGVGSLPFSLHDGEGLSTGCQVSNWTLFADNSWAHFQDANPNEMLMNSFTNQRPTLSFSGVPASYQSSGYQVVVYYGNNEGPSSSLLTLAGSGTDFVTRTINSGDTAASSYGSVGFLQEMGSSVEPTNFTVFSDLQDPSFIISLTGDNNNGLSAVQIIRSRTPYETWALQQGLYHTAVVAAGYADDPDQDGRSNLYEFAFHGDPLAAGSQEISVSGNPSLVLTLPVRTGSAAWTGTNPTNTRDGITYTIEGSLDLNFNVLSPVVRLPMPVTAGLPDLTNTGYEYQSFTFQNPNAGAGRGFLRARAVVVP